MTKTIAIQMDHPSRLNPASDTTMALIEAGQKHGFVFYHYQTEGLQYANNGQCLARAKPITVDLGKIPYYAEGADIPLDLRTVDLILIRQDPPFDMDYVATSYVLEQLAAQGVRVLNGPRAVRVGDHKIPQEPFADLMPPTLITRDAAAIRAFWHQHGEIVIKPLYGHGGQQVFHLTRDADNLSSLLELFGAYQKAPLIAQQFLPQVRTCDTRILLLNGDVLGVLGRRPQAGQIRSNLASGGTAEATTLTAPQQKIVARLAPWLRQQKIYLAGVDVIGDYLTEINVTSPTGFRAVDKLNGWAGDNTCAAKFWHNMVW